MAFADPLSPFFSFVEGTTGIRILAFLHQPGEDGRSRFDILGAGGHLDLDSASHGFWSPQGRVLVVDGEVSGAPSDVDVVGRYLVIEKDGSGTIEKDGSRHLEEGETLVTPALLAMVAVGHRHAVLAEVPRYDGTGPDDDLDAVGANGAGIGTAAP